MSLTRDNPWQTIFFSPLPDLEELEAGREFFVVVSS